MKKISLGAIAILMLAGACNKKDSSTPADDAQEEQTVITKRSCGSNEVLQEQLAADPSLATRMQAIEAFTTKAIATGQTERLASDGYIELPVVVHVVYNKNAPAQNISDAQIKSQIDVLNEDYQDLNQDKSKVPSGFTSVASQGVHIRFVLKQTIRKSTNIKSWSTNDAVKSSSRGGDDVLDPTNNLNIWVCNLGGGLLGYAQFPGGKAATDGVVILYSAFGSRDKCPTGTYIKTYDLGRSATHEVGHWMNLRHIWGDDNGACSGSDLVDDTPNQGAENYGTPAFPKTDGCTSTSPGVMFMNYMDYTDDVSMYMFSVNQTQRMLSVFASGGPRAAMGK